MSLDSTSAGILRRFLRMTTKPSKQTVLTIYTLVLLARWRAIVTPFAPALV
jgi:hypothetical protein